MAEGKSQAPPPAHVCFSSILQLLARELFILAESGAKVMAERRAVAEGVASII